MGFPYTAKKVDGWFREVNSLELGLRSEQLEWLCRPRTRKASSRKALAALRWKLSDTNADGLLDYIEFAQRIAEVVGRDGWWQLLAVTVAFLGGDRHQHDSLPSSPRRGAAHARCQLQPSAS